ncbi:MAG TPA: tetratricopeptide repeat protein [Gammaproteobacteria bacterium]
MGRFLVVASLAAFLPAASAQPDSRSVFGERTPLLAAGADAIRAGRYDDGIRLTIEGLETEPVTTRLKAAALANLCAAHAAKGEPDVAIGFCDESVELDPRNWRAYSNRSFAYWQKGMYAEATADIDAAASLAPSAPQVRQMRGLINEKTLRPRVTMENRQ